MSTDMGTDMGEDLISDELSREAEEIEKLPLAKMFPAAITWSKKVLDELELLYQSIPEDQFGMRMWVLHEIRDIRIARKSMFAKYQKWLRRPKEGK